MTITEVLKLIQANEDKFMGKKLGDAGHFVIGFEIINKQDGNYIVTLIGQDDLSGSPTVTKPIQDWMNENP